MTEYNEIKSLKKRLQNLERITKENSSAPRLSHSSIHDGGFSEYDADGNLVSRVGTQHDGTHGAVDIYGPKPPVPTDPTLSGAPVSLTIAWDGLSIDELGEFRPLPLDFQCVQILAKKDESPALIGNEDLKGVITSEAGGEKSLTVEHGTWHVALRMRTKSGRASDASSVVTVVVPNVVDLGEVEADIAQAQADAAAALVGASDAELLAAAAQVAADAAADDAALAAADAAAAAGLVADKGKVIIQTAEPSVGDRLAQNLWIDTTGGANTPKRWTGTEWVSVTDKAATDAASAAAAAQSTASTAAADALAASTAAGTALTAANGKNRINYGTSAPTASTPGRPGDIFWLRSGATITGQYLCTAGTDTTSGNTWTTQTLTNATIATLDAGKISTGTLNAGRIAAKSMTLDKLLIASVDNLLINPVFELNTGSPLGWAATNATVVNVADGPDGVAANVLRVTPLSSDVSTTNDAFKLGSAGTVVEHGKSYRFTVRARLVSGTSGLLRIQAGLYRSGSADAWQAVTEDLIVSESVTGAWVMLSGSFTMPATHDRLSVSIHASSASGSVLEVADVTMRSMADSSLVVDGSITSQALAAESVQTENLAARSVVAENLAAELTLSSKFKTSESGQRVEFDVDGIRLHGADDTVLIDLPTAAGSDPTFRGSVQADGLTVRQGAAFYSPWNEFARDSVINLAEQVQGPIAAPTPEFVYDRFSLVKTAKTGALGTFSLDLSQVVAVGRDEVRDQLIVIQRRGTGSRIWYYTLLGTLSTSWGDSPFTDHEDIFITGAWIKPNGSTVLLAKWNNGIEDKWLYYDAQFSPSWRDYASGFLVRNAMLTYDGTNIVIAETVTTDGTTRFRTVNNTAANPITYSNVSATGISALDKHPVFAFKGSADFGAEKYIVSYGDSFQYRVFSSAGNYQEGFGWYPPVPKVGAIWHPTSGRFMTIGSDGYIYLHSAITWTDSALDTWHVGQSFLDTNATGGLHESNLGSTVSFTMRKRASVRFTLADVPYTGEVDDPNAWAVYAKRGTAPAVDLSDMKRQAQGSYTVHTYTMTAAPTTAGSAALVFGDFPGGTPAILKSGRTLPTDNTKSIFEVRGDGSGRWGTLEVSDTGVTTFGGDTGWVTLPNASGITGTLEARRIGDMVHLRGIAIPGLAWSSTSDPKTIISALPAQFQPVQAYACTRPTSSTIGTLHFRIAVSGATITAYSNITTTSAHGVYLTLNYLAT